MTESASQDGSLSSKGNSWDRTTATAQVYDFERLSGVSQRAFAVEQNIPRTTLQHWLGRKDALLASPKAVEFFESPEGLQFLHQVVVAAHLVMTKLGNCGIRRVGLFLELCGLNDFVASSYGSQQKVAASLLDLIGEYGAEQRDLLAANMEHKKITVCEDETFPASGLCLVAIEPVSGFILHEEYAKKRDAPTWNAALAEATKGLDVDVVQSTSDEASALLRHAKDQKVHHSPDLFHVQYEVSRGFGLALASQERRRTSELDAAKNEVEHHVSEQGAYAAAPRRPGRAPDFDKRISRAKAEQQEASSRLTTVQACRKQYSEANKEISKHYHPYDLTTGHERTPAELEKQLETSFAWLEEIADEAELPAKTTSRLAKARRVVIKIVATLAFFHTSVRDTVGALDLPASQEKLLLETWIPAAYLHRAADKEKEPARRKEIREQAQDMVANAREEIIRLSSEEQERLVAVAEDCASLFQRSSSCVEGRNGQLALSEHALRHLTPKNLKALTIVQNYFVTRADGTTAAERFFGAAPEDLFSWLCTKAKAPPRPARARPRVKKRSPLLAAQIA